MGVEIGGGDVLVFVTTVLSFRRSPAWLLTSPETSHPGILQWTRVD